MAKVIVILGWAKYQHYKDRNAPWIKLYRDLLTAESWVLGTDESRLVQVASTLLAARYQNATPLKFDLFKKVASLDMTEAKFRAAIQHLTSTEFLEIQEVNSECKQDASTTLATCTSEREGEGEREGEKRERGAKPTRRCPQDFVITTELRDWASQSCRGVDIDAETEKFRDYEFAKPKSDWPATWRNWMRRAQSDVKSVGRPRTKYDAAMDALKEWDGGHEGNWKTVADVGPVIRAQIR